jgi:hypothetical protein
MEQVRAAHIERNILRPVLLGRDFEKWFIRSTDRRILYINGEIDLKLYPNAEAWLLPFRSDLKKRRECQRGIIPWYSLQWPRVKAQLDHTPKILVQGTRNPRLKTRVVATMDEVGIYGTQGMSFIVPTTSTAPMYYLLGVLNSKLINYLYATKFLNVAVKGDYLKDTPIPKASASQQGDLTNLVQRILAAKQRNPEADTSALEREIDRLVYRLYDLTQAEINVVEDAMRK